MATPPPLPTPDQNAQFVRLVIPKARVDNRIVTKGLNDKREMEDPGGKDDVAWYNFSAPPGTGSNAVFAAHVTWNGRAVFYDLKEVQIGDSIVLRGDNGTEIAYVVSDSFLVDPNDPNALSVMAPTPADVITIITCDGSFYRTSDPVFGGDYTNRRVVRATFSRLTQPVAAVGGAHRSLILAWIWRR